MKLRIDDQIFEKFPGLDIGVIVIKGVNNLKRICRPILRQGFVGQNKEKLACPP